MASTKNPIAIHIDSVDHTPVTNSVSEKPGQIARETFDIAVSLRVALQL
ncbi:MAG TPA: hypothetical protein VN541_13765 [Tepidisphaeraceae bacterium]|nr:hypothetical protein [Tepidisphaeraceae bacterium]